MLCQLLEVVNNRDMMLRHARIFQSEEKEFDDDFKSLQCRGRNMVHTHGTAFNQVVFYFRKSLKTLF